MDSFEAARAVLPAWLPFVPLLPLPAGFAAGWILGRVLAPGAYRWAHVLLPVLFGALLAPLAGPFSVVGPTVAGILATATALAGFVTGAWPAANARSGDPSPGFVPYAASAAALTLARGPLAFAARRLGSGTSGKALERLERTALDAPLPDSPGRAAGVVWTVAAVAVFLAAEVARGRFVPVLSARRPMAAVVLTGGAPGPLAVLARSLSTGPRAADATPLYRAAFALDARPGHLAEASFVESQAGRCGAARALAREAERAVSSAGTAGLDRFLAGRARDVAERCGREAPAGHEKAPLDL